jgi:hypothetical protein
LRCGVETYSVEGLDRFVKRKASRFGRENLCLNCYNKFKRTMVNPFENWHQTGFGAVVPKLLEAWSK